MNIIHTFSSKYCVLPFKQINFMKKFNFRSLMAWLTGDVENGLVQIRNISGQVVFETRTPLHKGENTVDMTFTYFYCPI